MRTNSRRFPRLRTFAAALLLSLSLVRPAAAVDFTDLWYTIGENAWGVNFVQSNAFIFATFFIYGPDNQPTWYTGQMSIDANGVWSGGLYRSTGTYFGAPWNDAQRTLNQVGTVTFTPSTSYGGTLTYNVDAVAVTKQINRLTLTSIPLGGTYSGAVLFIVNNCDNPANNFQGRYFADLAVSQITNGKLTFDFAFYGADACKLDGNYIQDGLIYRSPNSAYTCGTNFVSTASITQIKATPQGIDGQWTANAGGGCQEFAYFSAVLL